MKNAIFKTPMLPLSFVPLLLGLFVALGVVSASPVIARHQTYTLVCRGGPDMFIKVMGEMNYTMTATVAFRAAPEAANVRPPESGSCAWKDRALRHGEPRILFFSQPQPNNLSMSCQYGGCDLFFNSRQMENLLRNMMHHTLFEIEVYHDTERGFLINQAH